MHMHRYIHRYIDNERMYKKRRLAAVCIELAAAHLPDCGSFAAEGFEIKGGLSSTSSSLEEGEMYIYIYIYICTPTVYLAVIVS